MLRVWLAFMGGNNSWSKLYQSGLYSHGQGVQHYITEVHIPRTLTLDPWWLYVRKKDYLILQYERVNIRLSIDSCEFTWISNHNEFPFKMVTWMFENMLALL